MSNHFTSCTCSLICARWGVKVGLQLIRIVEPSIANHQPCRIHVSVFSVEHDLEITEKDLER